MYSNSWQKVKHRFTISIEMSVCAATQRDQIDHSQSSCHTRFIRLRITLDFIILEFREKKLEQKNEIDLMELHSINFHSKYFD